MSDQAPARVAPDAGLSCGLNDENNDLTVFGGVSVSLGRL